MPLVSLQSGQHVHACTLYTIMLIQIESFEPTSQVSRRHNPGPNDISPIKKVESVFRSHQVRDKIHQICNITSSAHSSQLSFSFYPAKAPQWEESDSV